MSLTGKDHFRFLENFQKVLVLVKNHCNFNITKTRDDQYCFIFK